MGAARAPVVVAAQTPGLYAFDIVVVAPLGLGTEEAHDGLPLRAVGPGAGAKETEDHQVGDLVGHGLVEESLAVSSQQLPVEADLAVKAVAAAELPGALAAQIEADLAGRYRRAEVLLGGVHEGLGADPGVPLQAIG